MPCCCLCDNEGGAKEFDVPEDSLKRNPEALRSSVCPDRGGDVREVPVPLLRADRDDPPSNPSFRFGSFRI